MPQITLYHFGLEEGHLLHLRCAKIHPITHMENPIDVKYNMGSESDH